MFGARMFAFPASAYILIKTAGGAARLRDIPREPDPDNAGVGNAEKRNCESCALFPARLFYL